MRRCGQACPNIGMRQVRRPASLSGVIRGSYVFASCSRAAFDQATYHDAFILTFNSTIRSTLDSAHCQYNSKNSCLLRAASLLQRRTCTMKAIACLPEFFPRLGLNSKASDPSDRLLTLSHPQGSGGLLQPVKHRISSYFYVH